MKKLFVVVVVLAIALVGANAAFAAIANSKHDLSSTSTASVRQTVAGNQLSSCQFCHTPHGANVTGGYNVAPLWNKTANSSSYQVYGGGGAAAGVTAFGSAVAQPGIHSMTCLACHDGVSSVGAVYVGLPASTFTNILNVVSAAGVLQPLNINTMGVNLQDDHPVGVNYNPAAAGLATAATITAPALGFTLYAETGRPLSFECASCHDVHNTVPANAPFLRRPKGTICSDCHQTK